ncbi:MAG: hypothetical protein AB1489_39295, partial [Acidobacteriota bacterium]
TTSFMLSNLDKSNASVQVKITATDPAGNKGEQIASFQISPVIMQVNYNKPKLTISGIGFLSNKQQPKMTVLINGKEIPSSKVTVNGNTIITAKGNKKKLAIEKGVNLVNVIIDGLVSNSAELNF